MDSEVQNDKKDHLTNLMSKYLEKSRLEANLSQEDIAQRSDVFGIGQILTQRTVSRVEKSPLTAEATKLAAYLIAVGKTPESFYEKLREELSTPLLATFNTNSSEINMKIEQMLETARINMNEISSIVSTLTDDKALNLEGLSKTIKEALQAFVNLNRKPIICVAGQYDSAKTTAINTLLEVIGQLLTEKYQPATSIVNIVAHIDDKPNYISNDVLVFSKGFHPYMLQEPESVKKYLIAEGDKTVLDRFGVHNYSDDDQIAKDAYVSVIFHDAEILKKVMLMDTPGDLNSADDSDTEKALAGAELADGVLYLSSFNGYMNGSDIALLSQFVRNKPPVKGAEPLGHIRFVLSHCHNGIAESDVEQIKKTTFARCKKQLDDLVFDQWKENGDIENSPTAEELSSRVVPFFRENSEYVRGFRESVHSMAAQLQNDHVKLVAKRIASIESGVAAQLEAELARLYSFKASTEERIEEVNEMDARFRGKSGELIAKLKHLIHSCNSRAEDDKQVVSSHYNSIMQQSTLSQLIGETYSKKKEAAEGIGGYLSQLLTARLEKTMTSSGNAISNEIELILREWQELVPNYATVNPRAQDATVDCRVDVSTFNARAAFIGGLSGLGSLGALSLYVSTIASNLGAYILVGKAAGVLTSIGLAGSVTSVTSLVAAMGGPITIGIMIAVSIGVIVYRLTGGTWQDALAKKVIEALKKEGVEQTLHTEIARFWENTQKAMKLGLEELVAVTDDYISKMKMDAQTEFSTESVESALERIQAALALLHRD